MVLAALSLAAAPALAEAGTRLEGTERAFHCDGTDPALFQEMQEAGWLGYGEAWDLHTCDQGAEAYVPGATSRWKALRLQKGSTKASREVSFYAILFPFLAFAVVGAMLGIAWVAALVHRRRSAARVTLACPSCGVEMPVPLDDPAFRSMFCPACGGACVVVDRLDDGGSRARVRAV